MWPGGLHGALKDEESRPLREPLWPHGTWHNRPDSQPNYTILLPSTIALLSEIPPLFRGSCRHYSNRSSTLQGMEIAQGISGLAKGIEELIMVADADLAL
jgi:hypothetical protein